MAKRRAHGEGSTYRRGDGRWVAVVDLGHENGRRRRKYIYGLTQGEVVEKKTALLTAKAKGRQIATGRGLTLGAYLADWLEHMGKASSTERSYAGHVRNHVTPAIGHVRLEKLQPADIRRFLDALPAKGLSKASVVRVRATLSVALNRAVDLGHIAYNPVTRAKAPRPPAGKVRHKPMDSDELKRFLKFARVHEVGSHRLWPVWALLAGTGMRLGEALSLRWEDVSFAAGTVHVREGKSDTSTRTIPLPAWAQEALEDHQNASGEHRGLVFHTATGRPLDGRNVHRWYKALLEEAGVEDRRLHDLRHTFATRVLEQTGNLQVVSELLGHASISITSAFYVSSASTAKRAAAASLDDLVD